MNKKEAEKTAKEIADKTSRKVIAIQTDITKPNQIKAMVKKVVNNLGGLDVAFNNVGTDINVLARRNVLRGLVKSC